MNAPNPSTIPSNSGFLMGESPFTLVLIGAALLGIALVCDSAMGGMRWHVVGDERAIAFFGNLRGLYDSVAIVKGFTNSCGYALVLFGAARMVALAGPRLARAAMR